MTDVRFYHLTRSSLEAALPQLLEKTLERGARAVVMAGSEERVESLAVHLWTYNDRNFLPHGSAKDGSAAEQPIWLTAKDENPNGAKFLFMTDGAISEAVADYALCATLFDGKDEAAVAQARDLWQTCKAAGHEVTYWQQDDAGRWSQKA